MCALDLFFARLIDTFCALYLMIGGALSLLLLLLLAFCPCLLLPVTAVWWWWLWYSHGL